VERVVEAHGEGVTRVGGPEAEKDVPAEPERGDGDVSLRRHWIPWLK